ncbi:GH24885 [Drosophila grimshawi]|uniref:GH24885 n=1 Tax=Drosophila grimshawi TaxID=7222 RepID=B4JNT9_DROGR|nr:GH24885 [Drosophila grimshawi]
MTKTTSSGGTAGRNAGSGCKRRWLQLQRLPGPYTDTAVDSDADADADAVVGAEVCQFRHSHVQSTPAQQMLVRAAWRLPLAPPPVSLALVPPPSGGNSIIKSHGQQTKRTVK